MRTERDVRENPVAGDVWNCGEDYTVQAVVGNLVAIETPCGVLRWVKRDGWTLYLANTGKATHIAQPGGDA